MVEMLFMLSGEYE